MDTFVMARLTGFEPALLLGTTLKGWRDSPTSPQPHKIYFLYL